VFHICNYSIHTLIQTSKKNSEVLCVYNWRAREALLGGTNKNQIYIKECASTLYLGLISPFPLIGLIPNQSLKFISFRQHI